jgi:hypothetical protein
MSSILLMLTSNKIESYELATINGPEGNIRFSMQMDVVFDTVAKVGSSDRPPLCNIKANFGISPALTITGSLHNRKSGPQKILKYHHENINTILFN